jgi:hypothetical protein
VWNALLPTSWDLQRLSLDNVPSTKLMEEGGQLGDIA